MPDVRPEDLRPHVDTHICGKCRKPLLKGQRCVLVTISMGKGVDPQNIHRMGMHMSDEFEFMHADCRDPYLTKGLQ